MIEKIKSLIYNKKLQVIQLDKNGLVVDTENTVFNIKKNTKLTDLHPFFESIAPLFETLIEPIEFACVNLEIDNKEIIADINLIQEKGNLFITISDFTEHYEYSHPLVQDKNEAIIEKYKLAFERDLLFEKEKFKNTFLANINHEIRNPLNNLLGFMDILTEDKQLSYNQKETLNIMQKTGSHLKVLMDDMLDISKIEKGEIEVKHIPFNVRPLVKNLLKHFTSKFSNKPIETDLEIDKNVPNRILGDPTRLNQILFNLINNAFLYTDTGTIKIKLDCNDKKVIDGKSFINFRISDTGKGFSKESVDTIFESYHQLRLKKIHPLGQGLGLKIVKELITVLHGDITVKSVEGKGTTFKFTLPFEVAKKTTGKKSVPKGSGILVSKRILIIEDKEVEQMLFMKLFLNNDKAYQIEIVKTPEQSLDLLEQKKYDLIIMKMVFPSKNGLQVLKDITSHNNEKINSTPVLMVSGNAVLSEQEKILSAGARDFLPKPFTKKELFSKLGEILKQ